MSEAHLEHAPAHHHSPKEEANKVDNLKFAMWLYLASEVVIFTILIATYIVFRIYNHEAVLEAHKAVNINLVGANTFILLTSSWAMVRGLLSIQRGNRKGLINWFWFMTALGVVFMGGQYIEYAELAHHGIAVYNNEWGMRFYAMTAFHGFHVLLGVLWAIWVIRRAAQGAYDRNYVGVEVFGLYWHFVDVVWIFLFTLIYLI